MIVLLDSGPLGLVTPQGGADAQACKHWLTSLPAAGHLTLLPEIIDYEHRPELLLVGLTQALTRLDLFKANGAYVPVSEDAYLQAAQFWATARGQGLPTADRFAPDIGVPLCAQAATFDHPLRQRPAMEPVAIATTNIGHLSRSADARLWQNIP